MCERQLTVGKASEVALFRHDRLHQLSLTPVKDPRRVTTIEIDSKASKEAIARRDAWLGKVEKKKS